MASSIAPMPGFSPRKAINLRLKTTNVESVDKRLSHTSEFEASDLWPKDLAVCNSIGWDPGNWNHEKSFEVQAGRLLLENGIEQSRYRRIDPEMEKQLMKMDAALFFGVTQSWHDVAVVIECKLRKKKDQAYARSQLKRAAELVFGNQFRLFVWGISVFSHEDKGKQMHYKYKLHLYTRSGVLYSKEHDLHTEFEQFCQLLVGFSNMTPTQHGWYLTPRPDKGFELPTMPSATGTNVKDPLPLHIPMYKTEMLHLSHVLAVRSGIDNRATLVVLGLTAKDEPRVVKLTWLSKYRAKRYERVLQDIKTTPIPGVPTVLYSGILDESKDAQCTDQYSTHALVRRWTANTTLNEDDVPDKQLFCVITDRPGVTIAKELSLERVFNTCADIVGQILAMERRGIYHRDVSSGNIFTRELKLPPTSEDSAADSYTPCGWLDDFDCTFIGSISSEEDIKHRDALCGTMPFMSEAVVFAIRRGVTYQQTGIDDLESVVWVLLWFFTHYIPRGGVGEGWSPVKYPEDVASHSMSADPATPQTKPSSGMLSPSPTTGLASRKCSLVDPRTSTMPNLSEDPLRAFFASYDTAKSKKLDLKVSGTLAFDPPGWNSAAVDSLFARIWSLDSWTLLLPRIHRFNPSRQRLPEGTTEKERMVYFSKLVQDLKEIFQSAAQHAMQYYPETGNDQHPAKKLAMEPKDHVWHAPNFVRSGSATYVDKSFQSGTYKSGADMI